jgi:hypothetical protein
MPKTLPKPVQKNWFGRECHPSDSLVHWSDDNQRGSWPFYWVDTKIQTFDEYIDRLRAAWDQIHSVPENAAAFKLLMDVIQHTESMEQGERDAGENL